MSMYRQLWLAIITSTLLALLGSLLASTLSARVYLAEQLAMKNADNASVLALSLSQQEPDAVMVELAVAALFDSGHYELIRVSDPRGRTIVERKAPAGEYDAPQWFVESLPIDVPPGEAQITSGWKQFGTVTLVSHSRFAYRALWKSALEMVAAMAFAGLVGGYLGTLILRRLRRPLQSVIDQAQAITEQRFTIIAEPAVPELRQLAAAMNATVARLKAMFAEEAARLETVRKEANCDPLTGLANRSFCFARLRASLEGEEADGGALILVRVADLAGINRRLGRNATDDLLGCFGKALSEFAAQQEDGLAARLNGADFALLLPGQTAVRPIAEALLERLVQEGSAYIDSGPSAFVGAGVFHAGADVSSVLAQVDAALAAAEAEGVNTMREAQSGTTENAPKSAEAWTTLIQRAIERRWVRLVSFPVADFGGKLIHRECPLRMLFEEGGEWQPAGRFLPVAERLRLTPQLDLAAVSLGLDELEASPTLPGLAINLSAASVHEPSFRLQLMALLRQRRRAAQRLWLEVAETGALKHLDGFRALCRDLKDSGCHLGLEHFGREFSQIGQLHDLGLDYVKVDSSFIRRLDTSPGNQSFLKGLCSISHGIGMRVIAEGVISDTELGTLSAVGFDGATGPAVKDSD
jgi:EAL domain-containing protein (putative c-di-GMP-specific phosphodiesterase class I)/GGDEF domain-containing protein